MRNSGEFHYIKLVDDKNKTIVHGYTDNPWMAKMFYKSLEENKIIKGKIVDFQFTGDLTEFNRVVRNAHDVIISGEDIITTFPITLPNNDTVEIVSTCNIVFGGGFSRFAQYKLLPKDRIKLRKCAMMLYKTMTIMHCNNLKNNTIDMKQLERFIVTISSYNLCLVSSSDDNLNKNVDDELYGIMRGWYYPI